MSSPLDWPSSKGADVRYHLGRVHAVAQTLMFTDCKLTDSNTIPTLIGIVLDEVTFAVSAFEQGGCVKVRVGITQGQGWPITDTGPPIYPYIDAELSSGARDGPIQPGHSPRPLPNNKPTPEAPACWYAK